MVSSHGWSELDRARKKDLIQALCSGRPTPGPSHVELDLTDRCNASCYFCNQQDLRTRQELPIGRVLGLIDELVDNGMRSVRLSGGGDPLFHRDILEVLRHLNWREVSIDNLTTNGIALGPEVADALVCGRAREVICSLNTVDGDDYSRMLGVRPAFHARVLENVRRLVRARARSGLPVVTLQFLLDRHNHLRLPEMYELGRGLGVDRIAINRVLEVPRSRIEPDRLLTPDDCEAMRAPMAATLSMDREAALLQACFPFPSWNEMLSELQAELGLEVASGFETAPAFSEADGQCFFSWYHATVTGSGDVYPCCLLLSPDTPPLGNILDQSFHQCWNGPRYARMRAEQRDVLLTGGRIEYRPERFEVLARQCVEPYQCWLKNLYFRGDGEFYADLGPALARQRHRGIRWLGHPDEMIRKAEVMASRNRYFRRAYRGVRKAWASRSL